MRTDITCETQEQACEFPIPLRNSAFSTCGHKLVFSDMEFHKRDCVSFMCMSMFLCACICVSFFLPSRIVALNCSTLCARTPFCGHFMQQRSGPDCTRRAVNSICLFRKTFLCLFLNASGNTWGYVCSHPTSCHRALFPLVTELLEDGNWVC